MNINVPSPGWYTLGELELPVDVSTDDAIHAWLAEILSPLDLSPGFQEKVLSSVKETAGQAFQPAMETHSHIYIAILVPHGHILSGKSWGYFHIERIEPGSDNINSHVIAFYLYVEGD